MTCLLLPSLFFFIINHDAAVDFPGFDLIFEPQGEGGWIRTTATHKASSNTQPGSLDDERLHQCFTVIYPLPMMAMTFHVIMESTSARPLRDWRAIDSQQKKKNPLGKSPEFPTLSHYQLQTGIRMLTSSIYDLAEHICDLYAWTIIGTLIN